MGRIEAGVAPETLLEQVDALSVEEGWTRRKVPVFRANGPVDLPVRLEGR